MYQKEYINHSIVSCITFHVKIFDIWSIYFCNINQISHRTLQTKASKYDVCTFPAIPGHDVHNDTHDYDHYHCHDHAHDDDDDNVCPFPVVPEHGFVQQ